MPEILHYFVGIFIMEISKLIFAFDRLIQAFLSDFVPSSLMNFGIFNSILGFSIFPQTFKFRLKTIKSTPDLGLEEIFGFGL